MAYPQAPAEMPLYMRLPQGCKREGTTRKTNALKLVRNIYGQKQAGRVWNKYMDQGMKEIGFKPSAFVTEFRQPLQVQSHLEVPGILVQLGHTQRT